MFGELELVDQPSREKCWRGTEQHLTVPQGKDQGGRGTLFPAWFFPSFGRSTILQQQFNRTGKVEHGSVALPAIMRSGSTGPEIFNVGSMPSPQQQVTVGQMHRAHMPPLVSPSPPPLSEGGLLVPRQEKIC